jgi:hypothetical protein
VRIKRHSEDLRITSWIRINGFCCLFDAVKNPKRFGAGSLKAKNDAQLNLDTIHGEDNTFNRLVGVGIFSTVTPFMINERG